MKRLIISIALVAVAATSAMAQVSVGAGYLSTTTKTTISDKNTSATSDGFYVGADAAYNLGAGFSVIPGLYYGYAFSKDSFYGVADAETKSHYLSVPVNFKYGLPVLDVLNVFAYAGPQFNFGLASKTTATALGVSSEVNNYGDDSNLSRFDIALGVGLGFDVADMIRINFGYNWGLLDLNKSDNIKMHNNNWHVGVAFLF